MTSKCTIEMPYIGGVLSINHCYYRGTRRYKKAVVDWMGDLSLKSSYIALTFRQYPVIIRLTGTFKNHAAAPDLHNLHKVIADALAHGLGMNDQWFRFEDEGYGVSKTTPPKIVMKLTMGGV